MMATVIVMVMAYSMAVLTAATMDKIMVIMIEMLLLAKGIK